MSDMASPPKVEDQGRLLEEALGMVRQQASQMRRCLETPGKLMDALKCGYGECDRREQVNTDMHIGQHWSRSFEHLL